MPSHGLYPAATAGGGFSSSVYGVNRSASVSESVDHGLVWCTLAVLLLGLVMVYSATVALPDSTKYAAYQPTHFLIRHAFSIVVAFAAAFCVFQIPMKTWQELAPLVFLCCIALLVLVLIPGIGKEVNGARRWLSLYVLNIQPSELMKVCAIMYAADYTVRKQAYMQRIGKVLLPMVMAMFLVGMLLLLEPDMGAFIVIVTVVFAILFLGGINARVFFGVLFLLTAAFAALIAFSDYRRARLLAYLDPWEGDNALNKAYQLSHSLIAFGRGEVFGVGLGGSVEKLHYLPEAHTDFLLAVIGEELGFVGVTVVILLFAYIVKRCFAIGSQAVALERTFSGLLAKGVGVWLAVQCFINMGVNLGVLPTKGLTLPLMSYGGSAILVNCIALALVLRTDYENRTMMRGGSA
ncbi:putative lipid II flippase FtsW [Limnobacter sp.]|uniref:putative lipid II flippase FtsW n=1 Tax=Limnobacter sp. TaxID=2003368 RepID=UPI003519C766